MLSLSGQEGEDGSIVLSGTPKWDAAFFSSYAGHEEEAKMKEQYNTMSWGEQIGMHGTEDKLKIAVKDGSCWPVIITDSTGKKHKMWQTIRFVGSGNLKTKQSIFIQKYVYIHSCINLSISSRNQTISSRNHSKSSRNLLYSGETLRFLQETIRNIQEIYWALAPLK